jgi:hypothetical protein
LGPRADVVAVFEASALGALGGAGRRRGAVSVGGLLRRKISAALGPAGAPGTADADAWLSERQRWPEPPEELDGLDVLLDLTTAPSLLPVGDGPTWVLRFGADGLRDPVEAWTAAALAGATTIDVTLAEEPGGRLLRAGTFGLDPVAPWASAAAAATAFTLWPGGAIAAKANGRGGLAPYGALPAFPPDRGGRRRRASGPRLVGRAGRHLARRALWAEVWTVGLAPAAPSDVVGHGLPDLQWLPERGPHGVRGAWEARGFAADPFLYRDDHGTVCLFEALDYRTNRGWIAAVDVENALTRDQPLDQRTVFRNEWHWSYPFVFEDGSETYCIPETADAAGALLHRLTPSGFEQEADLLPGLAVLDPTLVRHDDRYWLFCTLRNGPLLNTALHLFVADRLHGPYRPHGDNPVKVDVRSARPAGSIVEVDGQLYRPGQDCGLDYGAALVLHRIDELSEDAFRETRVAHLTPAAPYGDGLHTLSFGGGWVAVDAKRYAFSPPILATRLAKAKKLLRPRRG